MKQVATTYLLDTNVVSEWVKPRPDGDFIAWLHGADEDRVFLSVATLAELSRGIQLMATGRRRQRLAEWLADELPARFENRILGIDHEVAMCWGRVMVRSQRGGVVMTTMDAFYAATAEVHGMTLVTRNVGDFQRTGVPLLNPWKTATRRPP